MLSGDFFLFQVFVIKRPFAPSSCDRPENMAGFFFPRRLFHQRCQTRKCQHQTGVVLHVSVSLGLADLRAN